jgi:ketosteroid isomerase-like protein
MSELAEFGSKASQELTSFIREGLRAFIEFFQTSQFDKMADFYSPDTTLMLPHREVIRGADKLPALFRELKNSGLQRSSLSHHTLRTATQCDICFTGKNHRSHFGLRLPLASAYSGN